MGRTNRWSIGFDYELENWSEYSVDGESGQLPNASRMSVGLQYTPEVESGNYFKKNSYSVATL